MIETKIKQVAVRHSPPDLPVLYIQLPQNYDYSDLKKLEGEELDKYVLTLKKQKNKSLTANNYMWQLCDKIAKKTKVTKEDIYRQAVREVGAFMDMVVRTSDAEQAAKLWATNGIGWFAEEHFKGNGTTVLRFYQGSSVYDGEQMRYLIDYVVDAAQEQGIETMTPNEIERLKQLWDAKVT